MGDPRKRRKTYSKPLHPWQKDRIEEEKILIKEYGLKNKKEIWKADSILRNFKSQAKRLITLSSKQAEVEKQQLLKKLVSLGLLDKTAKVEEVLGVELKHLLDRRLQTVVFKNKLAKSVDQARQFIVHRHVAIGDKVLNVPSYLVPKEEEGKVSFRIRSSLYSQDHPERVIEEKAPKKKVEKKAPAKKKELKKDEPKKKEEKKAEQKTEKKPKEEKPKEDKKEVKKE